MGPLSDTVPTSRRGSWARMQKSFSSAVTLPKCCPRQGVSTWSQQIADGCTAEADRRRYVDVTGGLTKRRARSSWYGDRSAGGWGLSSQKSGAGNADGGGRWFGQGCHNCRRPGGRRRPGAGGRASYCRPRGRMFSRKDVAIRDAEPGAAVDGLHVARFHWVSREGDQVPVGHHAAGRQKPSRAGSGREVWMTTEFSPVSDGWGPLA